MNMVGFYGMNNDITKSIKEKKVFPTFIEYLKKNCTHGRTCFVCVVVGKILEKHQTQKNNMAGSINCVCDGYSRMGNTVSG